MNSDSYDCPICTEIARNAVETQCCHNLMCEQCSIEFTRQKKECPLCRAANFNATPSLILRKMIGNLPIACKHCQFKTTQSELDVHQIVCPNRSYHCGVGGCNFTGMKSQFLQHGVNNHEKIIVQILESPPQIQSQVLSQNSQILQQQIIDPTVEKLNGFNRPAKISYQGKYYCGNQLDEGKCFCCNGNCGPTNGCNCSACQELDLKLRSLPSKGYAVNSLNRIAIQQGKAFYCGMNYEGKKCIQSQGQCDVCKKLNHKRYSRFLN